MYQLGPVGDHILIVLLLPVLLLNVGLFLITGSITASIYIYFLLLIIMSNNDNIDIIIIIINNKIEQVGMIAYYLPVPF